MATKLIWVDSVMAEYVTVLIANGNNRGEFQQLYRSKADSPDRVLTEMDDCKLAAGHVCVQL